MAEIWSRLEVPREIAMGEDAGKAAVFVDDERRAGSLVIHLGDHLLH